MSHKQLPYHTMIWSRAGPVTDDASQQTCKIQCVCTFGKFMTVCQ